MAAMDELHEHSTDVDDGPRHAPRWWDHAYDAELDLAHEYFEEEVARAIADRSLDAVRTYLGTYGDAVMERISRAHGDAHRALEANLPSPTVVSAVTAVELLVGHLLVRPLVHGLVLSDEWAELVTSRVVRPRSPADNRQLLPSLVAGWELGVDLEAIRLPDHRSAWSDLQGEFIPLRNRIVHEGEVADWMDAVRALECSETLTTALSEALAERVELDWPALSWNEASRHRLGTRTRSPAGPFREPGRASAP